MRLLRATLANSFSNSNAWGSWREKTMPWCPQKLRLLSMPKLIEPPPYSDVKPVTDTLHGVAVIDSYRWLEDQESPDTRSWLSKQTEYTRTYLDAIVGRDGGRAEVEDLLCLKEVPSEPWSVGGRYYFLRRAHGNDQPQIIVREGLFGDEEVLVDPATVKRG